MWCTSRHVANPKSGCATAVRLRPTPQRSHASVSVQALVRQVLAFADLSDSDESEPEPAHDASSGFSEYRAAAPVAPAPVPVPPPAGLRPIRVAPKPESLPQPRSFTPLVRSARSDDSGSPERVSPTSVLPPPRAASGNVYTYFDKNSGMLVTATVPMPTPAPVHVVPRADSEEDDWDAPDRSFIAGAQAPPPPPVVVAATIVPPPLAAEYPAAVRSRKAGKAARSRGRPHPLLGLLAAAAGVGLAVFGKEHIMAGAVAARDFVTASVEATRRMRADADAAERAAVDEPAMEPALLHKPAIARQAKAAAVSPAPRGVDVQPVTEWQLRSASRPASSPPPSETPEAWRAGPPGTVREVRWQPHVSLGRG